MAGGGIPSGGDYRVRGGQRASSLKKLKVFLCTSDLGAAPGDGVEKVGKDLLLEDPLPHSSND